jgi:hypothetical protein
MPQTDPHTPTQVTLPTTLAAAALAVAAPLAAAALVVAAPLAAAALAVAAPLAAAAAPPRRRSPPSSHSAGNQTALINIAFFQLWVLSCWE